MSAATTEPETRLPLAGVRVVVTRPAHQAEGLCRAFAERGATVERLPLLEVTPPADPAPLERAVASLPRYRWVAFTSANAVDPVADLAAGFGGWAGGWPGETRVAAVGGATAEALRRRGLKPEVVADGGGAALAREMAAADPGLAGAPALLPLAADARRELAEGLAAAGAEVEVVTAYGKGLPAGTRGRAGDLFPPTSSLGWVTFTSPRIARTFARLVDDLVDGGTADRQERGTASEDDVGWEHRRRSLLAASIGPTTSTELRALGVEPAAEADPPGADELAAAVVRAVAAAGRLRP